MYNVASAVNVSFYNGQCSFFTSNESTFYYYFGSIKHGTLFIRLLFSFRRVANIFSSLMKNVTPTVSCTHPRAGPSSPSNIRWEAHVYTSSSLTRQPGVTHQERHSTSGQASPVVPLVFIPDSDLTVTLIVTFLISNLSFLHVFLLLSLPFNPFLHFLLLPSCLSILPSHSLHSSYTPSSFTFSLPSFPPSSQNAKPSFQHSQ